MSNNQGSTKQTITWTYESRIIIPPPEKLILIRSKDWNRIRRNLSNISKPILNLSKLYSILFGCAITTGASILSFIKYEVPPSFVRDIFFIVFGVSLLGGFLCVYLERRTRSSEKAKIEDILSDMTESGSEVEPIGSPTEVGREAKESSDPS